MLGKRQDIIGDLYRLRQDIGKNSRDPDANDSYDDLELLAAIAVALGMPPNIVNKASNIPIDRLNALTTNNTAQLQQLGSNQGYQTLDRGIIAKR